MAHTKSPAFYRVKWQKNGLPYLTFFSEGNTKMLFRTQAFKSGRPGVHKALAAIRKQTTDAKIIWDFPGAIKMK